MLIDTHCHLDIMLPKKTEQLTDSDLPVISAIVERAKKNQVEKIINIGCNILESKNGLWLSEKFENVFATIGIHPTELNEDWKIAFSELKKVFDDRSKKSKLVGIGEIGLDFYHKPFNFQKQKDGFLAQFEFALKNNFPVVIHCREAATELLEILKPYAGQFRGVMHCFQQSEVVAIKVIEWGLMLGIDGPINYPKNSSLREICQKVGLANLILETDSPFLPPQELRGKSNEPANIIYVAQELAKIFNTTLDVVGKETTKNATNLFRLNDF